MTDVADLKQSTRAHCLHWLTRGHCDDLMCVLNERRPWLENLTGWTRDGNPELMFAYPVRLTLFDLQDMVHHCFQLGLMVALETRLANSAGAWKCDLLLEFRRHDNSSASN